jgi:hypothetical protein
LDNTEREQQSATPAQQEIPEENDESFEVIENYGGPGVSRTRDLRFRNLVVCCIFNTMVLA